MNNANRLTVLLVGGALLFNVNWAGAQDWPQWRGPNRDARATGFTAPTTWPKELTQKWKVTVGEGVATPALVGDKLYVFSRQDGQEVTRCLELATGKELWQDKYESEGATGAARGFSGPRCSPTVAGGKVVTLGVRGVLSCVDAANGKLAWRKNDFKGSYPRFFVSSSPIIVDGLCIAQLGGGRDGAIIAYDLATGDKKWSWTGGGAAYASPVLLGKDGARVLIAETDQSIVGLDVADGKLLWKTSYAVRGRGYNASTPVVDGNTLIYSGSNRGTKAVKLEKRSDELVAKELWSNPDISAQFSSPVVKNGLIFGINDRDKLFCLHAGNGKTAWTSSLEGRGRSGYGSIVDAGSVLLALNPSSRLIVFEPSSKEFKQIAGYKVADTETYAYPVVVGKRIFVKDRNALILWTID